MTLPRSFHLPPNAKGFEVRATSSSTVEGGGFSPPPVAWARFDRAGAESLVSGLRGEARALAARPVSELVAALGAVGRRFLDPGDTLHEEAVLRVSRESGLSPVVARATLEGMARDWTEERLGTMVVADFPDPGVLDGFRTGVGGDLVRASGGDFSFHLASGNVPGVGASSLIRSLLVKSPVLLKPGREDIALPLLFARALGEMSPGLSRAVAIVYWPRGEGGALDEIALSHARTIVGYGGSGFLRQLRESAPITTPFVAYHHRLSVGAVGRDAIETTEAAEAAATEVAAAVAAFDCRGCVSPKIIWVEQGGAVPPEAWAGMLAARMDSLESREPSGPLDDAAAASLHQRRGVAELRRAGGRGTRVYSGGAASWTVFYEPEGDPTLELPGPGRSVLVQPISRLEDLPRALQDHSDALQSLAVATSEERRLDIAWRVASSGITRVTTFQRVPWPPAWWRHDGMGPLSALVRWTSFESDG